MMQWKKPEGKNVCFMAKCNKILHFVVDIVKNLEYTRKDCLTK